MNNDMVRVTIRLPKKLLRQVKRKAKADTKTASLVIREAVLVYLQNNTGGNNA